MNIAHYLLIAGKLLGAHAANHGVTFSDADYEGLWSEALDEFFATEKVSEKARRSLSERSTEEKIAYFANSTFSLHRFKALLEETIQAHQH